MTVIHIIIDKQEPLKPMTKPEFALAMLHGKIGNKQPGWEDRRRIILEKYFNESNVDKDHYPNRVEYEAQVANHRLILAHKKELLASLPSAIGSADGKLVFGECVSDIENILEDSDSPWLIIQIDDHDIRF